MQLAHEQHMRQIIYDTQKAANSVREEEIQKETDKRKNHQRTRKNP